MAQQNTQVIMFDGVCNFCNASINFIMARDPKGKFKFAPLQSDFAHDQLTKHGRNPDELESVVLIDGDRFYTRSSAALHIAKQLTGLWPVFYVFIIIPSFLRDLVYKLIANNRYRWFGKRDHCRIPTPDERNRFIG